MRRLALLASLPAQMDGYGPDENQDNTSDAGQIDGLGAQPHQPQVVGNDGCDHLAGDDQDQKAAPMRQMAERFISDGMLPDAGDMERWMQLLGRPLRTYGEFAAEHA